MTTATINGTAVKMSIYDKAKLLNVSRISGEDGFVVSSGSDAHTSYRVSEDCQRCNCGAYGKCAHRVAAETRRDEEVRSNRRADVYEYCACCMKPFYPKTATHTTCGRCSL